VIRVQTAIIVVLAILVFVLAVALVASRSRNSQAMRSIRPMAPPSPPPPGLAAQAAQLVAARKPIHAVKLVREQTGWDLVTSKAFVDRLGGHAPRDVADITGPDDLDEEDLDREVRVLLEQGKVVHAVKLVREATGWGLADAKRFVDQRRGRRR
jgi:large subunit ribosomal protein L7/L12